MRIPGTVENLFKSYTSNERNIDRLERMLELMPYRESYIKAQVLTGMPHTGGTSDPTPCLAISFVSDQDKMDALISKLKSELAEVDAIVDRYKDNPKLHIILDVHVRKGKSFETCAYVINKSNSKKPIDLDNVKKLYYRELCKLEKQYIHDINKLRDMFKEGLC
jgi:hypothetical protein